MSVPESPGNGTSKRKPNAATSQEAIPKTIQGQSTTELTGEAAGKTRGIICEVQTAGASSCLATCQTGL
eukprot:912048-Lingulodinium_polyedra.AAC.1